MSRWISILEYAVQKNVSVSTLRRYIKSGKIQYRVDQGKYLIWDDSAPVQKNGEEGTLRLKVQSMELDLREAREEIAELKTLIALYEQTIQSNPQQKNY